MTDIVPPSLRSRMMAGIRSKNTRHELTIRKELHRAGFRYRLHRRDLPGTPDITLPRYRAVIFVHGCFWHGHDCHLFKWPSTRPEFWRAKIESNKRREHTVLSALFETNWRVCTVWECSLRGRLRVTPEELATILVQWLRSENPTCAIRGVERGAP